MEEPCTLETNSGFSLNTLSYFLVQHFDVEKRLITLIGIFDELIHFLIMKTSLLFSVSKRKKS